MYDKTKLSAPLPNWSSTFTLRPELEPPGYTETLIYMLDNPRPEVKEVKQDEKKKKKKTRLGRNEKR